MVQVLMLALLLSAIIQAVAGTRVRIPWLWFLVGLIASEAVTACRSVDWPASAFTRGCWGRCWPGRGSIPARPCSDPLPHHGVTQLVDYLLGGGALGIFFCFWMGQRKRMAEVIFDPQAD